MTSKPHGWVAVIASAFALLVTREAHAASSNLLVWFVSRVDGWSQSPSRATATLLGLVLLNYAMVSAIVGYGIRKELPRFGSTRMAKALFVLTLAGQVLDRCAAIVCAVVGLALATAGGAKGEAQLGVGLLLGICLNVLVSGAGMAILVRRMLGGWGVRKKRSVLVAVVCGLIANPAWSMAIWFFR